MSEVSPRAEWARHWPVPVVAMLGITGPAAFAYISGVFMVAMTREFGWSRTQFSSALTLQMLAGLIVVPTVGRLLDRFGPRTMALAGIVPFMGFFSLLGLANGVLWQWWLLVGLLSVGVGGVMPTIWIAGIVRTFNAARGAALSVALAGIGVATALWPPLTALYIHALGWRLAFAAVAITWGVVVLPLTWWFFRPTGFDKGRGVAAAVVPLPPVLPLLLSARFIGLLLAGGLFAFAQLGLISHFVPLAQAQGLSLGAAAGMAAVIGLFSILGRLGSGFLLDWLPTRPLAVVGFSLLLGAVALIGTAHGSRPQLLAGAMMLGLTAGCEIDVLTYVASRSFTPRAFGAVYASLQAGLSILASLGPLVAGKIFDTTGSYDRFLWLAAMLDIAAVVAILVVLKNWRGRHHTVGE